jgi:hypothetical protein
MVFDTHLILQAGLSSGRVTEQGHFASSIYSFLIVRLAAVTL